MEDSSDIVYDLDEMLKAMPEADVFDDALTEIKGPLPSWSEMVEDDEKLQEQLDTKADKSGTDKSPELLFINPKTSRKELARYLTDIAEENSSSHRRPTGEELEELDLLAELQSIAAGPSTQQKDKTYDQSIVPESMRVASAIQSKLKEKYKVPSAKIPKLSESSEETKPSYVAESIVSQHEVADLRNDLELMASKIETMESALITLQAERDVLPSLMRQLRISLNEDMSLMQAKLATALEFYASKTPLEAAKVSIDMIASNVNSDLTALESQSVSGNVLTSAVIAKRGKKIKVIK